MELSVAESGPADGPTLLFVHGGGISRWMWEPILARLSDYHCLVPDLPGHGASADIPFVSIADCADRLVDVIRTRAHRKVATVIGLSLGSQILLTLMARYPGRVGRAILSGTLARPMTGGALLHWRMRAYAPFRNLSFLAQANMRALNIPDSYFPLWAEETRRLRMDVLERVTAENMAFALPPGLDDVTVPTLLLTGEREKAILHRSAEDLVGRLRNGRSGEAQGVGHAWNLEAPDLFADTVRAWVEGRPLPERIIRLTAPPRVELVLPPVLPIVADEDDEGDWWEEA